MPRLALLLPLLMVAAAAAAARAEELAPGTVRLAILSDTHLAGPEYPLNGENGPVDNESITKTQQRMYRVVRAINAMRPRPQLALFGGDVVHNGVHHVRDALGLSQAGLAALFNESVNGFTIARDLLQDLEAPKLFMWGNHDNLVECGDEAASASKDLTEQIYEHYFDAPPYDSRDVGPWKVVALNPMYGYTWDPTSPRCATALSSYGEQQLRWLDGQLAEGKPTLVMTHFPLATSVEAEVNTTERWSSLRSVLLAHPNVKLVLSGHFHRGLDWESLYPFPALTLPSTRYSPQNFFVIDLKPDGTFDSPDFMEKNRGGARCSDWWSYDGAAEFVADVQPKDGGDCGAPTVADEPSFQLAPVLNKSSIPTWQEFNPEGACRFNLSTPFLEACAGGATEGCCDVAADVFRPSSSAFFSTCLCQPTFWEAAVGYLQQRHGVALAQVLGACVAQQKKMILYRGGPLSWCPAEATPTASA